MPSIIQRYLIDVNNLSKITRIHLKSKIVLVQATNICYDKPRENP